MPNSNEPPVILWLASWYPCRLDAFNGDFVQRSARALATRLPVQVFYLMKDEQGILTKSFLEETTVTGLLTETRLYYHPLKTGIAPFDKMISAWQYTRFGRRWLTNFKNKQAESTHWIVEVAVAMRAGTLALWMKREWKQPFVVQEHWTGYYRHLMPPNIQRGPLFWKMNQRILKEADALLPDSRHLGEWIHKTMVPMKFTEIPNVVDTEIFHLKMEAKPTGIFRFIHVSTLGFQKNTDGILRCFMKLMAEQQELKAELLVVGPGHEEHEAWVKNHPLLIGKVIFTGPKSNREVASLMQTSHALVLFSRYENLPCVMLEAFCCGLPVIATRVGGIAYHLPPSHGLLVDSENEGQLLAALKHLITHYGNYENHLIEQAARVDYGVETIAKLYIDTYTEIYPQIFKKTNILVG